MAVPILTFWAIAPGTAGWDALIASNFEQLRVWLSDGPLPLKAYAAGVALPSAAVWDRAIVAKHDGTAWRLEYSNGTAWEVVVTQALLATPSAAGAVKQAAVRADVNQTISNPPTQAEVQALSDAFDDLLAKLRTAGLLAV